MPAAQRQPLNYQADDIQDALTFVGALTCGDLIDHLRKEVGKGRNRYAEAVRNEERGWRPPNSHVGASSVERQQLNLARSLLKACVRLKQLDPSA